MMYTVERLMKAVRDAGRDGQPFTLGEVRAELGLKARDKRELKRFRSRFRECSQILGANLEKLGPNTYRLKPSAASAATAQRSAAVRAQTTPPAPPARQAAPKAKTPPPPPPRKKAASNPGLSALKVAPPAPVAASSGPLRAPAPPPPAPLATKSAPDTSDTPDTNADNAPSRLIDRVGVGPRRIRDRAPLAQDPRDHDAPTLSFGLGAAPHQADASQAPDPDELPRNTRAAAFREQPIKLSTPSAQSGLGARLSGWLGRVRGQNVTADNTAATALSRLAVELQPKSAGFEYQWRDGKVEIKRSAQAPGNSPLSRAGEPRAADK